MYRPFANPQLLHVGQRSWPLRRSGRWEQRLRGPCWVCHRGNEGTWNMTDTKHGGALCGGMTANTAGCFLEYDEEGQFFPAYGDSYCNSSRALQRLIPSIAFAQIMEPRSREFAPSSVCERLNPTSNSGVSALGLGGQSIVKIRAVRCFNATSWTFYNCCLARPVETTRTASLLGTASKIMPISPS